MLELRIMQGDQAVPLFDLPTHLGREKAARELGDTIEGLIAYLDNLGGDPDLEATYAEDDFVDHPADGPGCPVADSDYGLEERGEGRSWAEWHTLPAVRRRAGHVDGKPINDRHLEEDDELNGDEEDGNFAEDEPAASFARRGSGPGCIYSDPDKGAEEDGEREEGVV